MSIQHLDGPGDLRASDSDRQATVDALADAYADGRLTKDEFDNRSDAAYAAKTFGELSPLIADLGPGRRVTPVTAAAVVPAGGVRPAVSVAIFSSSHRQGVWTVPDSMVALALFGGSKMDMRQAVFSSAEVTINLAACFGGVDVIVPPGCTVINEVVALFGGVDVKHLGPAVAGAPVVRLRGVVVFGGATVKDGS